MSGEPAPRCRLCGHDDLETVLVHERAPANVSRLLRNGDLERDAPVRLEVRRCAGCGLVQLDGPPAADYYDDYVMTVSHSPQMRAFQRAQADRLVERFGLAGRRVLEVGCGDGNYLSLLAELGADPSGIEPSAPFRRLAERTGLPVHDGYVGDGRPVPGAPFDGFVTREVFEHVPDPNAFLRGIRALLTDDGAGLVEVPSLEQALERGRFFDFFPDHVNYWSTGTLARALERNGFLVEEVSRGMNGEYLEAWVRVDERRRLEDLQAAATSTVEQLRSLVARCNDDGRTLAAWGAGAKGLTTLALAGGVGVRYVVDSDPHKLGGITPVSRLPVVGPERLREEPVDVVVLTALAYRDEIIASLRSELGFAGTIAVLGPTLDLLEV